MQDETTRQWNETAERTEREAGTMQERTEEMTAEARARASEAAETARRQAERGREQVAEGTERAADAVRRQTESGPVPEAVGERVAGGLESTSTYLRTHNTSQILEDVEEYARKNPLQAMAAALVTGLIIGRILR